MKNQLSPAVIARQSIERKICTALIKAGLKAGYSIIVDDGETEVEDFVESTNCGEILKRMFTVDEEKLYFCKDGKRSAVFLTYGESGWDVICDYHLSLEPLMIEPDRISTKYQ